MITAIISAIAMGQSLLTAHLLYWRVRHSNVYMPLALFFFVNAIAQLCFILREPIDFGFDMTFLPELTLFKLIIELCLVPLFWIYVRELTSSHTRGARPSDFWHFVFPLTPCLLLALLLLMLSAETSATSTEVSLRHMYIMELNGVLNIAALMQFCFYVVLMMRRLAHYRVKLMSLFASTINMELRWFRWALLLIVASASLEIIAEVLRALYDMPNPFVPWNGLLRLALVWFFSIWGLRQRPDLVIEITKTVEANPNSKKYEKSALSESQLSVVAEKIKHAVERDSLYRDPTLSLRTLSEHINVLPNYVTQALSMEIGETFFDYVNRLRVQETMTRLESSDDTVLTIAAEAGFNSRSSFYAAFKKINGTTPTAYRKDHPRR